jgi:predicted transcriptional regulator of viral defense system
VCDIIADVSVRDQARKIFREHGILRTREALELGIHPETLYRMRDEGELEQLARGVYRLANAPELAHPELAAVAERAPAAVVCLISALSLHELTTEVPHEVHLAVKRGGTRPVFGDIPVRVYTFHEKAFRAGITQRRIQGVIIRLYDPEKTLVDTFRYRNQLGLDVFLEALNLYRQRRSASPQRVLEYAHLWRATQTIRPYLEQAFA